jgi:hypothetical protein
MARDERFVFELYADNKVFTANPDFKISADIFASFYKNGKIMSHEK